MTLVTYNAETGTQGATLTTANTGASTVATGAGCTATFDSSAAAHGSLGYLFVTASGQQNLARFTANALNTQMAFEGSFVVPSTPSATRQIMTLRYPSGPVFKVLWTTANKLQFQDTAGTETITTTETFTPGTMYRLALVLTVATATTGVFSANIYAGDSTTPVNATPYGSSTYNLGTAGIAAGDFGAVGALTGTLTVGWDDIRFNDGGTSEIGPVVTTRQGSGAGSVAFTGAAAGARAPKASGAGTVGFTASTAGARTPVAVGAGTLRFTGTAAGVVAFGGTVTGSVRFVGTATGSRSPKATCAGAVAFAGTASGTAPVVGGMFGNAAGALHLTGAAVGSTTRQGSAAGVLSLTGTVTGQALRQGSATGVVGFTTIAAGTNQDAADITVTAALDPRPWASTLTTRTNTGLLVQRSWEARLE